MNNYMPDSYDVISRSDIWYCIEYPKHMEVADKRKIIWYLQEDGDKPDKREQKMLKNFKQVCLLFNIA